MKKAEEIKIDTIKWLLNGGLSFNRLRNAIGTEVLFSVNKRKADLLIISKYLHSLEIKSDFDNIKKLKEQLPDYYKTFDKVSIITTPKHLQRVKKIITLSTGLILYNNGKFIIERFATIRKRLNKISLLMFLNKNKLITEFNLKKAYNLSTHEIRIKISKKFTIKQIRKISYYALKKRYSKLFRLLLNDTNGNIVRDELRGLSGKIEEIEN